MRGIAALARTAAFLALVPALTTWAQTGDPSPQAAPRTIADPTVGSEDWVRLGPVGAAGRIGAFAVSPDWPDDPTFLAARSAGLVLSEIVRSRDGGRSWHRLPSPIQFQGKNVISLALSPRADTSPIAFLLAGSPGSQQPFELWRSLDLGESWALVLAERAQIRPAFVPSPAIREDGRALLLIDGLLLGTEDWGATWEVVNIPDRYIQSAAFSPDFARDQAIALATTTGPLPDYSGGGRMIQAAPADYAIEDGVLLSRDAGASWTAATLGLELDGASFPIVQTVEFSPTFAQDGTLFAFAWDGLSVFADLATRRLPRRVLFRSIDGGGSWAAVAAPDGRGLAAYPVLALSPHFATDGTGLFRIGYSSGSPDSASCAMLRTEDRGSSWTMIQTSGPSAGGAANCGSPLILDVAGSLVTLRLGNPLPFSADGGRTWTFAPGLPSSGIQLAPDFARDATVFAARLGVGIVPWVPAR